MNPSLRSDFAILEVKDPASNALRSLAITGRATRWGAVGVAVDADGRRHLLLPTAPGAPVRSDCRSAGVHVGEYRGFIGDSSVRYVDVLCVKPHLHDIFIVVADEILERLATDEGAPDEVAIRVLTRWRHLLDRDRRAGPSDELLTGLFGELVVLKGIAAHSPRAVDVWTGPSGAIWDFHHKNSALEVKASRTRGGWSTKISSVHQLDTSDGTDLHLILLQIERQNEGETSIGGLVDDLVRLGIERQALLNRLDEAGVSVEFYEHAMAFCARVLDRRAWRVQDGFPRITRHAFHDDKLPLGVTTLAYGIDLSATEQAHLSEAALEDLYRRMAPSK